MPVHISLTQLAPPGDRRPILVVGPSLGTGVAHLWQRCVDNGLAEAFEVIGWDLPGHGANRHRSTAFSMADLATAVLEALDTHLESRSDYRGGAAERVFAYAGDSTGGAVGLQLMLDHPGRVTSAVLMCTGPQIGTPDMWRTRATTVQGSGTAAMVTGSAERWFAPGFLDQDPPTGAGLLSALTEVDDDGYAHTCGALAAFDVRDRLGTIPNPVLAVAGASDQATPPALLRSLAEAIPGAQSLTLDNVAHLPPAEAPAATAHLIRQFLLEGQAHEL